MYPYIHPGGDLGTGKLQHMGEEMKEGQRKSVVFVKREAEEYHLWKRNGMFALDLCALQHAAGIHPTLPRQLRMSPVPLSCCLLGSQTVFIQRVHPILTPPTSHFYLLLPPRPTTRNKATYSILKNKIILFPLA